MDNKKIIIKGNKLYIPLKAYVFMHSPKNLKLRKLADQSVEMYIYNKKFLDRSNARFEGFDDFYAIFSIKGLSINGEYNFINYHPLWSLVSVEKLAAEDSTMKTWTNIKNYHEHRPYQLQDSSANNRSIWLARDVLNNLLGEDKSIMEFGCGAGRNLYYIHKEIQDVKTFGFDINENAVQSAKKFLVDFNSEIYQNNIYDTSNISDNSIDVVYTSGVLMHIPHENVEKIIKEMHRIAKCAVVHFELHGQSNSFDYHRYPRDYEELYKKMKLKCDNYKIYPNTDYRSSGINEICAHSLLISKIR